MSDPKTWPQTKLVDEVCWGRTGNGESWQTGRLLVEMEGKTWFWRRLGDQRLERFGPFATFQGAARAAMHGKVTP